MTWFAVWIKGNEGPGVTSLEMIILNAEDWDAAGRKCHKLTQKEALRIQELSFGLTNLINEVASGEIRG